MRVARARALSEECAAIPARGVDVRREETGKERGGRGDVRGERPVNEANSATLTLRLSLFEAENVDVEERLNARGVDVFGELVCGEIIGLGGGGGGRRSGEQIKPGAEVTFCEAGVELCNVDPSVSFRYGFKR